MQPIRSVKNQYRGINAHLHSFWQETHRWNRFHNVYVTALMQSLNAQLITMGYIAEIEDSLQIRRLGESSFSHYRGDVTIYDVNPPRPASTYTLSHGLSVAELLEPEEELEHPYSAIVISSLLSDFQEGEAVAWLEVLSPTNKGGTEDAKLYRTKRRLALEKGLVFVEIDYLHETPPTFPALHDYSRRKNRLPEAHPYRIVILDPRPDLRTGPTALKEFDADEVIPTLNIPLNAGDTLVFNFGIPYQQAFENSFYGMRVDYSEPPVNFNRYSEADQLRIITRMLTVIEAAKQGHDLEQGPFPLIQTPASIEEALERLEKIKAGDSM